MQRGFTVPLTLGFIVKQPHAHGVKTGSPKSRTELQGDVYYTTETETPRELLRDQTDEGKLHV